MKKRILSKNTVVIQSITLLAISFVGFQAQAADVASYNRDNPSQKQGLSSSSSTSESASQGDITSEDCCHVSSAELRPRRNYRNEVSAVLNGKGKESSGDAEAK